MERLSRVSITSSVVLMRKEWQRTRRRLFLVCMAVLGGLLGVLVYIAIPDESDHYRALGSSLGEIHKQDFDGFWACALRGADPVTMRDAVSLANEIHRRGAQGRGSFGRHVKTRCLGMLKALGRAVHHVESPAKARAEVEELADASDRMAASWDRYIAFLDKLDDRYDPAKAEEQVTDIARSWRDYRRTSAGLYVKIRKKVGSSRDYY